MQCETLPKVDQRIERDPDGGMIDLKDNIVLLAGRRVIKDDCERQVEGMIGLFNSTYGDTTSSLTGQDVVVCTEQQTLDQYQNLTSFDREGEPEMLRNAESFCGTNPLNQVATTPDNGIAYDANGNLTTRADGRVYRYDLLNNLTHVYIRRDGVRTLYARF